MQLLGHFVGSLIVSRDNEVVPICIHKAGSHAWVGYCTKRVDRLVWFKGGEARETLREDLGGRGPHKIDRRIITTFNKLLNGNNC